jgi:cytochrome c oxidase subunit 2
MTENLSIFDPAAPPAESIRDLSILVNAICGFIFVVVEGILIYCLIRFRRRGSGKESPDGNDVQVEVEVEPPQVYGSMPIEIAWTASPALIVFVLLLVTTRTLWEVKIRPPAPGKSDNALYITVIGRQWWWQYVYDEYDGRKLGFTTANELHIPVSESGVARPVYLTLKSADVCHSFWVPRLAGKTDLIPGKTNVMWIQADRPGLFVGQCAEYCGTQHANMLIRLVVESPREFQSWLEREAAAAVDDASAHEGKSVFLGQSCVNCHAVRGTPAQGGYAPDLTHLMSRRTLAAGMAPNTPENLRRWVDDPQAIKPGCLMPAFGLSTRDRKLLVDYLETLR